MDKEIECLDYIESYIKEFASNIDNGQYVYMQNNIDAIKMFSKFLNIISDIDVEFKGDGTYIGKRVYIHYDNIYLNKRYNININIEYTYNAIRIYNGDDSYKEMECYVFISGISDKKLFLEFQNDLYMLLGYVFGLPIKDYVHGKQFNR